MKKITVIFGGTMGLYSRYFQTFKEIDKKFNIITRRTGPNKITANIKDIKIEFLFCYHAIKTKTYLDLKKRKEENWWKELVPVPADKLIKKIKNPDIVLFFGLCGGFQGKNAEYYIPKKFSETFFGEYIKHEDIPKAKTYNPIKITNLFSNEIKSHYKKMVTSDITLMPQNVEKGDKQKLIELVEVLSKQGDAVDLESYQIAKHFKSSKLGMAIMSSDIVSCKKRMMKHNVFKPNKKRFNNLVIKGIEIALKDLH